ncbi:MAG TPA: hypothetical protein VG899_00825 [Mycobacteriales bacterium]|nr:hypothetical protein [Mycobacteriales bacterium]HWB66407.1 hypothetical protein [Mycobacteriales bacterium]
MDANPAGNARLTAWTGLLILGLVALQGVTLLALGSLISVHLFVGGVLVPLVLLKLATTGWRMTRFYRGCHPYVSAGKPPLALRLLAPLVIVSSLALLGTGLALAFIGRGAHQPFTAVAGFGISPLTLHQIAAIAWISLAGPHLLARVLPALRHVSRVGGRQHVPGGALRLAVIGLTAGIAVTTGFLVLHVGVDWTAHSTAALGAGK